LVNKSDLKGLIAESRWYISFLDLFGCADYQTDHNGNNEADEDNQGVRNNLNEENVDN